jgi:hypothetical protein
MPMPLKPWEGAYSTTWCIRQVCEDFGITPGKKVFAKIYTGTGNTITHRIADKKDATCIYIKRTIPPMPA